jgi:O-antigen/teichoic acid export membrane protein
MTRIKRNVIANYLGGGWSALIGLVFVPLYIHYLGIEAYGLIGVFAILQAWLSLLDMGMTPTLNREMARFTAGAHTSQSILDLLRSLELVCFAVAAAIGVAIWLSASWLSTHWLQAEKLPVETVAQAIAIIGFVVALRFVESLYRGAILGLQKQVWLSTVGAALATLRWGGAALVLMWASPDIEAFFIWQGLVSVLTISIFCLVVHRHMPKTDAVARFSWIQLNSIRRFAAGMMATTLLSLLLMQIDKIILSHMLNLEMFGYYTLAGTVAAVLYQLTGPITQAYYPRFTELLTTGDTAALINIYHQGAQLVSVMIVPVALMLAFFAENILLLWTGNAVLAQNAAPLLALLVLGTMLNGLMHIPYMLTLAYAWPGFGVRQNVVAVILLVPAILWATPRYGAIGAAWIWFILNAGYVLLGMHYLHRHLLKHEKWHWYFRDIGLPAWVVVPVAASWMMHPDTLSAAGEMAWLLVSGTAAFLGSAFAVPALRARFHLAVLDS